MVNQLRIKYKDDQGQEQQAVLDNVNNIPWIELTSEYFISIGLDPNRYSEGELIE